MMLEVQPSIADMPVNTLACVRNVSCKAQLSFSKCKSLFCTEAHDMGDSPTYNYPLSYYVIEAEDWGAPSDNLSLESCLDKVLHCVTTGTLMQLLLQ